MSRFSYVKYDESATRQQDSFKKMFENLENFVDSLEDGRAKALVYTKLEEAYMWIGKSIRDSQVAHRQAEEQPERKDG
jgi:hypothetical protein